jgi:hypothetical protein
MKLQYTYSGHNVALTSLLLSGLFMACSGAEAPSSVFEGVGSSSSGGGGGGSVDAGVRVDANPPMPSSDAGPARLHPVSVNVIGLQGSGLVLQNNRGDDLAVSGSATEELSTGTFATKLPTGSAFAVTIKSQPSSSQACHVVVGTGTVGGADTATALVSCKSDEHYIAGEIVGLRGEGAILQNTQKDDLALLPGAKRFIFPVRMKRGEKYAVTVKSGPKRPTQQCRVERGEGTVADADVTDAKIVCETSRFKVGGVLKNLAGRNLVLQNNGGDDLPLAASGAFSFPTTVESGASYAVSVKTQPNSPVQRCQVRSESGVIGEADVASVVVDCGGVIANVDGTQTTQMTTPFGAFHDSVSSDPMTGKVYVFPSYNSETTFYEYPDFASFQRNTGSRRLSLDIPYEGTYHIVRNGFAYYAAAGSNTLVRADVSNGRAAAKESLVGAGHSNQSHYNWGGYSDINFYLDTDLSVYVAFAEPDGLMQIAKLDANSLVVQSRVQLDRRKVETGWGFIANSIFYYGDSYDQAQFGGAYSITDGSHVVIPPGMSFTATGDYITSVFWDPTSKNLFEITSGNTLVYPNVF